MLELFVTGADQNSDKIFVIAGLMATMQSLGYSTGVYKPIELGVFNKSTVTESLRPPQPKISTFSNPSQRPQNTLAPPPPKFDEKDLKSLDTAFIRFCDPYIRTYSSYKLRRKGNPLVSAAEEGIIIEKKNIFADYQNIQDINECLIVDGTCGLGTPLSKDFLEEDMIKMFDLPLLLVVSIKNAVINNIIMTINHAKEVGIRFRGVILNNYPYETQDVNIKLMPRLIEEYTGMKILGILSSFTFDLNPNDLITEVLNGVDIEGVFNIPIAKLH